MLRAHMSDAELALLDRHAPLGGKVLEFGCGGSTLHFFAQGAFSVTSVESDARWIEEVTRQQAMLPLLKSRRWLPIYGNLGETRDWGRPVEDEPQVSWLSYHQLCWDMMPDTAFDLVFIDGRFRVACLCQSLLRCSREGALFIMHDFWDRPLYHPVLELCDVADRADTAVVFRRKADMDWRLLCLVLQAYQFEPE